MSRETILQQYLDTVKGQYSHILIDCQPSLGMPTANALAAERKTLNQRYLALKEEVKEAKKTRKGVYSILRQEQREQQPRRAQDMTPQYTQEEKGLKYLEKGTANMKQKAW